MREKVYSKFAVILLIFVIILIVLSAAYYLKSARGNLKINFLNVGQGDAILITTPLNKQILIDGGPEMNVLEELGKVMPFFRRSIDLIILTHPHRDHISGLIEVLKRYEVKEVLFTGISYEDSYYEEFLAQIIKYNISTALAQAQKDYNFEDLKLDILYPFNQMAGEKESNLNNTSIVIKLEYKNHHILLMGDAEKELEDNLLSQNINLSAEILKIGHHGSKNATYLPFLNKVTPIKAVISVGSNNDFSHPHIETLNKLILNRVEILRTDFNGRVKIEINKEGEIKTGY